MAFVFCNPNPNKNLVGDCTVRAISLATDSSWEETYLGLAMQGFLMSDMPSSNNVWGAYLRAKNFTRNIIPDECPDCYTVADFADEYDKGTYILATGTHVVTVKDGDYLDTWDSGNESPIYYWQKEE